LHIKQYSVCHVVQLYNWIDNKWHIKLKWNVRNTKQQGIINYKNKLDIHNIEPIIKHIKEFSKQNYVSKCVYSYM
jgi:hypothetical protein